MSIVVKGKVRLWKNGQFVYEGDNLVVNNGLTLIAQLFATGTASNIGIKAMACATSAASTSATQAKLSGTEKGRARTGVARSANRVTFTATFAGISAVAREFGVFNATSATSGTMLARFLSSPITLGTGDSLKATWQLVFGTATI